MDGTTGRSMKGQERIEEEQSIVHGELARWHKDGPDTPCCRRLTERLTDYQDSSRVEDGRATETACVPEAQLQHAHRLEALGSLAGRVAHDFNNILSVLAGYGALMEQSMSKEDPNLPYLREMLDATDRAAHLTQSLLIFGGKQAAELKRLDLNELIEGMRKTLLRLVGEEVDASLRLAPEKLPVLVDGGQLERVLMNFVTNARDAMPGGGALTLETERLEVDEEFVRRHEFGKPGTYALVSVSDTGHGMDDAVLKRSFEPFFTTKELGKGTGLGLSIVYGIVQQHNGYIKCHSEPGKGTTFEVYLPLLEEERS